VTKAKPAPAEKPGADILALPEAAEHRELASAAVWFRWPVGKFVDAVARIRAEQAARLKS
jgi:hypothetical protein